LISCSWNLFETLIEVSEKLGVMACFIASHIVIIVFVLSWNKGVTIDLLCQGQRKVRRLLRISKPKQRFLFFEK
jgi:hypothetical protein